MILFYQISIDLFIFIIHHQVLHEPLYILNIIYNKIKIIIIIIIITYLSLSYIIRYYMNHFVSLT